MDWMELSGRNTLELIIIRYNQVYHTVAPKYSEYQCYCPQDAMENHGLGHLPQPDNFTTIGNNLEIEINQYNCPISVR